MVNKTGNGENKISIGAVIDVVKDVEMIATMIVMTIRIAIADTMTIGIITTTMMIGGTTTTTTTKSIIMTIVVENHLITAPRVPLRALLSTPLL